MTPRTVTIRAKPAPIEIDTSKTAVIVVDMQNDFATKGGLFDHAGVEIAGAKTRSRTFKALSRLRAEPAFRLFI